MTVLVDKDGGKALVPVTVEDSHRYTLVELAWKLNGIQRDAKQGNDKNYEASTDLFKLFPTFMLEPITFALSYMIANLGMTIPGIGMKPKNIGHFMISNIGTLGMNQGFAPLCPPLHAQFVYCIGKIEKRAVVRENDEVVVRPMVNIVLTCDHRFGDAALCK